MRSPSSRPPRLDSPIPETRAKPPLAFRILAALLPILAVLLLLTTVYLFHLHHAHHRPEDDASNLDHVGQGNGGSNSPGGSALRHKMDLAHFLLQRYDQEQTEKGRREAMDAGVWKGGNEENFIKLVESVRVKKAKAKKVVYDDDRTVPGLTWEQLQRALLDEDLLPPPIPKSHVARGFSGLPPDQTPALEGARRGSVHCPGTAPRVQEAMSSMLAFWNEPRGDRDQNAGLPDAHPHPFVPPPLSREEARAPRSSRRRYLTFEPDTGGWNNIRMSLENVAVLAASTGRTLVLPPDQIVYLLHAKKGERQERNYYDFFNLTDNGELHRRVPIISSEEFLRLEGGPDGYVPLGQYNSTHRDHLWKITKSCEERKKSDIFCEDLYDHYKLHGQQSIVSSEPPNEDCFLFDAGVFTHGEEHISKIDAMVKKRIDKFCGNRRHIYYNKTMHDAPVWHFETMDVRHRLLVHFYSFVFFTDPKVGNYYRRFVRDFFRYHDEVWCAAGKIVLALQYEDHKRRLLAEEGKVLSSLDLDSELVGGYSSLHIRRGDLQFKEVKFDSLQWYSNTKEIWKPHEILYIATDERDKSFFDNFRKRHFGPLRFFDDYRELAGLDGIDPTKYGMIETVVASRGSVFAGTWFSTFSGYIIRLRGYYGVSKFFSYYSWLERKFFMHRWAEVGEGSLYAREYPTGWTGIDGDVWVHNDTEGSRLMGMTFSRDEMEKVKADNAAILIAGRYPDSTRGHAKDNRVIDAAQGKKSTAAVDGIR